MTKPILYKNGFSHRNKLVTINDIVQVTEFDNLTRNNIISFITQIYKKILDNLPFYEEPKWKQEFCSRIDADLFGESINYMNRNYSFNSSLNKLIDKINDMNTPYNEILDIIEFIYKQTHNFIEIFDSPLKVFNIFLKENNIGYHINENSEIERNVDSFILTQIVDTINNHNELLNNINRAKELLTSRKEYDYKQSIQNSMLALESYCKSLGKTTAKNMKNILSEIQKKVNINSDLIEAINRLYKFASNVDDIRHSTNLNSHIDYGEAFFILTIVCALINYIDSTLSTNKIDIESSYE